MKSNGRSAHWIRWSKPFAPVLLLSLVFTLTADQIGLEERGRLFFQWVINISLGSLAHNGVIWLWLKRGWLPFKKSLPGLLPVMLAGAAATVFLLTLFNFPYLHSWSDFGEGVLSVLAVCALMQALIYPTRIYEGLLEYAGALERQRQMESGEMIELRENGESFHLLGRDLSAIFVEDHYLHFIHRHEGQWQTKMQHGKLKDWEERLPQMVRPNRSWLLNPLHIEGIGEMGIRSAGVEEWVKLSDARRKELERLALPPID